MFKWFLLLVAAFCLWGSAFVLGGSVGHVFVTRGLRFMKRVGCRILGRQNCTWCDPLYPAMSSVQRLSLTNAVKLTYVGDLILLREAIERARKTGAYDFSPMFKHVGSLFEESDFAMGVLEGPLAGSVGYTTSNYDDGVALYNNFPDEYARAIKGSGIDFVVTANNHFMDKGVAGALRTLDCLDRTGIRHDGTFRRGERDKTEIVEIRDRKVAILSYTYGSNYLPEDFFFDGDGAWLTRTIVARKSRWFSKSRRLVAEDIARAKRLNPALIIVMPHMGEEFQHSPNEMQKDWVNFFVEQGADIVLSDHPHAVQPIEWINNGRGGKSLVVYCPGNFINSYTQHDGDASMLVEAYLDPKTFLPVAASIVPLFAYGREDENYEAWPIDDFVEYAMTIPCPVSISDMKRCEEVHRVVTKSALGVELPLHNLQRRYFTFPDFGYVRQPVKPLEKEVLNCKTSRLLADIQIAKSICFVGDSITEGTKNGGYGWFEPLMALFPDKKVTRVARGGETIKYFNERRCEIVAADADVYVIAVGCNDIRYRNPGKCAMDVREFVLLCETLVEGLIKNGKTIYFISPWKSLDFDPWCRMNVEEKRDLYAQYDKGLKDLCRSRGIGYINPNDYIRRLLDGASPHRYLVDHIHPNASSGIRLYSEACVKYKEDEEG